MSFLVLFVLSGCSSNDDDSSKKNEEATQVTIPDDKEVTEEAIITKPTEESNTKDIKEEVSVPREHQNALKAAENYIGFMHFSEPGLRDQLEFEKYPSDAIDYAIMNVSVDYNEMALKAAINYQKTMPMSDDGLREQLDFEGYTSEQISYALANLD